MTELAETFRSLHTPGRPLLMPNPWDVGSARVLASMGFAALATTSGGFAMTLGRLDGSVTGEEALAHAAGIVAAVDVPVSADLEDCYADTPQGVAGTVRGAVAAGLAGCSIEDARGEIFPVEEAAERVRAAVEAAAGGLVLTARCENYLHGRPGLADTIARLQAYQEAGADVLYAPRMTDLAEIRTLVSEVDRPVNVLAIAGAPPVAELAESGVARISVGAWFTFAALGAALEAAEELREQGTYSYMERARAGYAAVQRAFGG
jgi:2-methylisocitrate lyase-like PEP mutase family enzyme